MCLVNSIIIYSIIMLIIYISKPRFIYNKKYNKFNSLELIGIVLPIIIYYLLFSITKNHRINK